MKAIITNKIVDKTFEGVECFLVRRIVYISQEENIQRFTIETHQAIYEDAKVKLLSLKAIAIVEKTQTEIDFVFEHIKTMVNFENGFFDFNATVVQIGLLLGTQQDLPWGTLATDWEMITIE